MLIHENIRFMRHQKGLSQEEMAHLLNMSTNGYGNIERGQTSITLDKLLQISTLLDLTIFELLDSVGLSSISLGNKDVKTNQSYCSLLPDKNPCTRHILTDFMLENSLSIIAQLNKEVILLRRINSLLESKLDLI